MDLASKIRGSFEAVLQGDPFRIKEANDFFTQCEKDPSFIGVLFQFVDSAGEHESMRFQAFMLIKNIILRQWKKRGTPSAPEGKKVWQRLALFNNEQKKEIRTRLVQMLQTNYQKKWRETLNEAIIEIIKADVSGSTGEVLIYIEETTKALCIEIQKGNSILQPEALEFFRTVRKIFRQVQTKRTMGGAIKIFEIIAPSILVNFITIWRSFSMALNGVINQTTPLNDENVLIALVRFSRTLDVILLLMINCGKEDILEKNSIEYINLIDELLGKAEVLSSLSETLGAMSPAIRTEFFKCYKILTYNFSVFQYHAQLAFANVFTRYLNYSWKMINAFTDPEAELCTKGALYMLLKVLKSYTYYCPEPHFLNNKSNGARNAEAHSICFRSFMSFFTKEVVQQIMQVLITRVMMMDAKKLDDDLELAMDFEDQIYLTDYMSELENSFSTLSLLIIENLYLRFPLVCDELYRNLLMNITNGTLDLSDVRVHDNVLKIFCQIPNIMKTLKDNVKDMVLEMIDISPVLEFLKRSITKSSLYSRRFCLIIKAYHEFLSPQLLVENTECILELVDLWKNDSITQYQAVMAVTSILESLHKLGAVCSNILIKLTPILITLLESVRTPQTTWKVMGAISKMLEHAENLTESSLTIFRVGCFRHLSQDSSEMTRNSMADMLIALICAYPSTTVMPAIFELAVEFLEFALNDKKVLGKTFEFWYFIIKEYTPSQGSQERIKMLIHKHFDANFKKLNDNITRFFIQIVEEYLLLGYIDLEPTMNYLGFLTNEVWVVLTRDYASSEAMNFEIKQAILSLYATSYLHYVSQNATERFPVEIKKTYAKIFLSELIDFSKEPVRVYTSRGFFGQVIILLNRLIIESPLNLLNFAKETLFLENLAPFYQTWIKAMGEVTSRIAQYPFLLKINPGLRTINAVALFAVMPLMGPLAFAENLPGMLRIIHPEIESFLTKSPTNRKGTLKREGSIMSIHRKIKISDRKEASRQVGSFEGIDLLAAYKTTLNACFASYGITDEVLFTQILPNSMSQETGENEPHPYKLALVRYLSS